MVQTLTTILTVVTALGAIWAALASTSQARASSAQARVAERGLEEQIRSFREQNEVARLTFEVDMMLKLEDRWESPTFLDIKRKAANHVKEHFFTDDGGLLEVEHIDENIENLLGIFELLGDFVKQGVLRAETVWHQFGCALDNTGLRTGQLSKRYAKISKMRRCWKISSNSTP